MSSAVQYSEKSYLRHSHLHRTKQEMKQKPVKVRIIFSVRDCKSSSCYFWFQISDVTEEMCKHLKKGGIKKSHKNLTW